jgi:hypothetical protein
MSHYYYYYYYYYHHFSSNSTYECKHALFGFLAWLILLNTMIFSSIHFPTSDIISFFFVIGQYFSKWASDPFHQSGQVKAEPSLSLPSLWPSQVSLLSCPALRDYKSKAWHQGKHLVVVSNQGCCTTHF